ncbi:hypothetical protein VOLCADRAFT_87823 [Volvox carteri f. nagariensis]|uniref:Uncharacterized protein n=1 Tax=Volvox carteri f. nagariensis TaxID=3068 RepID=D8TMC3_VOLCA|nr:uncharacterized protein VOLCADRAFT_87823 [Volvox carteri f. nagariensis]EFJ51476.1 hypothetical protein VOLCADRAFT_87823 [Volvox carteri f. nagariensis]|eukprot:XP_002947428.1 hypothetical protein VOLCADRAFT_87823 [Volvox carteri f. nagariensis]
MSPVPRLVIPGITYSTQQTQQPQALPPLRSASASAPLAAVASMSWGVPRLVLNFSSAADVQTASQQQLSAHRPKEVNVQTEFSNEPKEAAIQRNLDVATPKEVSQLVEYHIHEGVPLLTRMVVTGAVLTFCGLLRFDDLSHVLVHTDLLHVYRDRVEIFLFKSKTDQHCKGAFVTIGRIGGPCCPVLLLEQLLEAGHYQQTPCTSVQRDGVEADTEDVGPLLRAVNVRRNCLEEVVAALPSTVEAMPYCKFRDTLRTLCYAWRQGVRCDLCPHSLCCGGATALVQGGADRAEVQKLGRWKSNTVFEFVYVFEFVADSPHALLSPTLGSEAGPVQTGQCPLQTGQALELAHPGPWSQATVRVCPKTAGAGPLHNEPPSPAGRHTHSVVLLCFYPTLHRKAGPRAGEHRT